MSEVDQNRLIKLGFQGSAINILPVVERSC